MNNTKVELMSPAGDWASLRTAVKYGADSVYFGVKDLNMRKEAGNFDLLELDKITEFLHKHGKKGYLAINTIVYDNELGKVEKILKKAKRVKIDAVILWDMGALNIARDLGLRVHLSTQASVSNFSAVRSYNALGVKRIVLARECGFEDIKNIITSIKKENIDCEIETFVHGAMCVSISGRCFLSLQSFSKSANRGECLQPCRRKYLITDMEEQGNEYILGEDYILSPRDLCAVSFIDRLIKIGISSFKIEGRMRNPEYVKETASTYRAAIDAVYENKFTAGLKKALREKLLSVYNKGFTDGFYWGIPDDTGAGPAQNKYEKIFLGEVANFYSRKKAAAINVMYRGIKIGDEIAIYGKSTPLSIAKVKELQVARKPVAFAEKGTQAGVKLPFKVRRKDKVFFYQEKRAVENEK